MLQGQAVSLELHAPRLLDKAIEDLLVRAQKGPSMAGHYRIAKEAIKDTSDQLFAAIS